MRQRWLFNLALLIIIAILGAFVYYTMESEKEPESPKLTDLEANTVQNIHIERAAEKPISLMKDGQYWQMIEPFNLPANTFRIENLLEILSEREYKELEVKQLADFGLEPPLATIKFDQLTVAYGDSSPMRDSKRYVQINQKVYLISDTTYHSIVREATNFIALSPLGHQPKIKELKMPDYHFVLNEGQWTLTSTFSADEIDTRQDAINALIENWERLSAFNVKHYFEETSEEESATDIEITLVSQEQPIRLAIISKKPDLILARPAKGIQYEFSMNQVDSLLHLPTKKKEESESTDSPENSEDKK
jgi:hypothetical protein